MSDTGTASEAPAPSIRIATLARVSASVSRPRRLPSVSPAPPSLFSRRRVVSCLCASSRLSLKARRICCRYSVCLAGVSSRSSCAMAARSDAESCDARESRDSAITSPMHDELDHCNFRAPKLSVASHATTRQIRRNHILIVRPPHTVLPPVNKQEATPLQGKYVSAWGQLRQIAAVHEPCGCGTPRKDVRPPP